MWTFLTSAVVAQKMREVALYGSEVIKVTGTYDQTNMSDTVEQYDNY